jgi:lipopolysaccharide export LptBFGC system permease protein LptF
MLRRYGPELKSLATVGMAVFGPLALISLLFVLVSSIGRVNGLAAFVAVISVPMAILAVTLYLAVDLGERYSTGERAGAPADDGGSDPRT